MNNLIFIKFKVAVIVTTIVVTLADEYYSSSYYQTLDRQYMCLKCPPGTFLKEECRVNGSNSTCQPCINGYMHEYNFASQCIDCLECTEEQTMKMKCNSTHNAVCVCPEGQDLHTYLGGTRKCLPLSTRRENGEVLFKGSSSVETVPKEDFDFNYSEEDDVIIEPVDRDISETIVPPPDDAHRSKPTRPDTSGYHEGWTWTWLLAIFTPLSVLFLCFLYYKYELQFSIQIRRFRTFASGVYRRVKS